MAGGDVAERVVEDYLAAVATSLVGPRAVRAAILDELRDGLHAAIATRIGRGEHPAAATAAALNEFGAPEATARGFAGELASSQARRTVVAYLGSGPLIGLLWLLTVAPPGWWRRGPATLWAAIPPAPAIGLALVLGVLVLAATGTASRWLPIPPEPIVPAALVVVALAILGDLLMLALVARPDVAASTTGVLAILASAIRIGLSIPAMVSCLRVRRATAR